MKKLSAAVLAMLLMGLCACMQTELSETINTTSATKAASVASSTTEPVTYPYVHLKPVEIITDKSDPYSYVVKAYHAIERNIALLPWDEDGNMGTAEALTQGFQMQSSYGFQNLSRSMQLDNQRYLHYAFYDINGDGVKELLLGAQGKYNSSDAELFDIYTIKDGVAVQQRWSGWIHPHVSILENSTVMTFGGHQGWYGNVYYRFQNGALTRIESLGFTDINHRINDKTGEDEYYTNYYRYDDEERGEGVQISEAEYNRLQKQCEGSGDEVALEWRPLWLYKKSYATYQEAYRAIAGDYASEIQDFADGHCTALVDVNGDKVPELIYIKKAPLMYPETDEKYRQVSVHIWTYQDGSPRLIFNWEPSSHHALKAFCTDQDHAFYLYYMFINDEGQERSPGFWRFTLNNAQLKVEWSSSDQAVNQSSIDKTIFNVGISATPFAQEVPWDNYLAQHGNRDESMHISELLEKLN